MDDAQALELLGPVGIEMPLHADVIDRGHPPPPFPSTAQLVLSLTRFRRVLKRGS
jgi:hypothetical protein